ncbi:MAG: response regulator [Kiloniellales bacterium]
MQQVGTSATILVIDDDDLLRDTLKDILARGGYRAVGAANGDEGLELLGGGHVALVICDILMPGKEGIETIREIRNAWPDIKVVAISGGAAGAYDYLRAAKAFGADTTLTKPIGSEDLLATVRALLNGPAT